MDFVSSTIRLWALINVKNSPSSPDNWVTFEVGRCALDFERNAIPQCILTLALGRRADDVENVESISAVHQTYKKLKQLFKVSVIAQITPVDAGSQMEKWPPGPFRIFDGYLSGPGLRKTAEGAEFIIHVTHWLTDLNFSSSLSRSSHPANPEQFTFPAMAGNPGQAPIGGSNTSGIFTSDIAATTFFNAATIIDDLWAGNQALDPADLDSATRGLRSFLAKLCKQDRLYTIPNSPLIFGAVPPSTANRNFEALRALRRFEPGASYEAYADPAFVQLTEDGYTEGVKVGLAQTLVAGNARTPVAIGIGEHVSKEVLQSLTGVTLWDKLVGQLSASYQFDVIPMVEKALVVPSTPGLRWKKDAKNARFIAASDYGSIDFSSYIPRPLRGVYLLTGLYSTSGSVASSNNGLQQVARLPKYESTNAQNVGGLVLFKYPPGWLLNAALPGNYDKALKFPMGSMLFPPGQVPIPIGQPPSQADLLASLSVLWDSYAKELYLQEVTRGRQVILSGRLRFDIAPGTLVKIEVLDDEFICSVCGFDEFLYGTVLRVSIDIDAQANKAGTTLQVGFIRTQAEVPPDDAGNSDGYDLTVEQHPVWAERWYGAPLISLPEFQHPESPALAPSKLPGDP